MMVDLVESVKEKEPDSKVPRLRPGDTVRVHTRIVESGFERGRERSRERSQIFQGVVLHLQGRGTEASFTVRRIAAHGIGVERTFFSHSPQLEKVEVLRHAHIRRARLYYLRGRKGRAARLREKRF